MGGRLDVEALTKPSRVGGTTEQLDHQIDLGLQGPIEIRGASFSQAVLLNQERGGRAVPSCRSARTAR